MFHVLVVDDEPMIRKGLTKLIRLADSSIVHIDSAENGLEALAIMARQHIDFLFTDIKMPKMDGLALCQQVTESYENVQIVVVSGFGDFEYAQKCMAYGVKQYLLKPVARQAMNETISELIQNLTNMRRKGYIPIAKLEGWLERLEEALWYLKSEETQAILQELKQYGMSQKIEMVRLRELLNEMYIKLVRSLKERDVYAFELAVPIEGDLDETQSFTWFEQRVNEIYSYIKRMRKGNAKDPIEEAKAYIERNLSKEITLDDVADLLGLNPSYFSQFFKQMTNETFVQYRIKRRMERAKGLLAIPHNKITDISYEVGYADHPHFTKTFKRITGYTPSEYREMLGVKT